jgi:hypothetical protein
VDVKGCGCLHDHGVVVIDIYDGPFAPQKSVFSVLNSRPIV